VLSPLGVGGPEGEPEPHERAAEHAVLGVGDETLQLGAHVIIAESERGAKEARQRRP
jgi:hypothetical protein